VRRSSRAAFVVAASLLVPALVHADARKECVAAADHGQDLRDKGKLTEAKKAFVTCARDECPSMVSRQCVTWLTEVEREIPTVNVRARDAQNRDLVDVNVIVDEVLVTSALDGRPMQVDPGVHTFRYQHQGDPDVQQQLVIRSGEKDRLLDVRFGGAKAPVAASTTAASEAPANGALPAVGEEKRGFRFPVFAGVTLGIGLASFVGMGVLIGTTASDVNAMRATCAGSCKQSDVDWANTRIILANVAMGVGIAGVGLGVLSMIVANVGGHPAAKTAWQVQIGPGSLGVSRAF
jgi:hypothetical protein